jgi:hypothetical protein
VDSRNTITIICQRIKNTRRIPIFPPAPACFLFFLEIIFNAFMKNLLVKPLIGRAHLRLKVIVTSWSSTLIYLEKHVNKGIT